MLSVSSAFLFNRALSKARAYRDGLRVIAAYQSIEHGLLSSCHEGSTLLIVNNTIWRAPVITQTIYKNLTGKNFKVYDADNWDIALEQPTDSSCFLLDCAQGDTIYAKLYTADCWTRQVIELLRTDTFMHEVRIPAVEEPLLWRQYYQAHKQD